MRNWMAEHFLTVIIAIVPAAIAIGWYQGAVNANAKTSAKNSQRIETIQDVLGRMQLDIALICAEAVLAKGGDPKKDCKTSRGK